MILSAYCANRVKPAEGTSIVPHMHFPKFSFYSKISFEEEFQIFFAAEGKRNIGC
jgi:hypothetical protein